MQRYFSHLVFALCLLVPASAFAARPFAETYSNVTQGAFSRAANSIMRCDRSRESAAQCNAIESTSGALQHNNNNTYTRWIDVDGVVDFSGDGNDDTFNSSTAQLDVPADATVVWAGLYWHGNTRNTSQRTGVAPVTTTDQVQFRTSTTAPYSPVTASWCSTLGDRFACYADVLSLVDVANADGTYGVANIAANTGQDDYVGGWELMVIYEEDTLPLRSITVFHGHQTYGGGNALNFVADDFLTPLMGPIDAEVGFTIAEGDHGTTDAFNFQSQSAGTATRLTDDLGNGSIEAFGVNVTSRTPAYRNTLGHDSDTFDVGNLVANGDSSATIGLPGSAGEQNDLIKVDFAVDVYFPLVTSQKTVVDLNGGDVVVGDTLRYTITVANDAAALDDAVNVRLSDVINPNLDFLPGSIQLTTTPAGGPPLGAKTPAAGDDIATWDSTMRTLSVNLGAGATATAGGSIPVGESTSITFDAVILPSAANQRVSNSAIVTFEGATLAGRNRVRIATATSDDPDTQPRDSTDVNPTGDPDGDGLGDSDADEDNDGILDVDEGFGTDVSGDSDDDGLLDYEDPDQPGFVDLDSNGVDDRFDIDGDGIPNHLDLDSDGDGLFDLWEARGRALDANNDGQIDVIVDVDQDGVADAVDPSQGGTPLTLLDTDNDGDLDPWDSDDDGDGILTSQELADATVHGTDLDGDMVDPWYDLDSDGDGIDDEDETQDIDVDGVPDYLDPVQDFLTSPADGASSSTGEFTVTGTTEAGATVVITFDDGSGSQVSQTVVADGTGAFGATFTGLGDATYTVSAEATDSTGASFTQSLTVVVSQLFVEIDQPTDQDRTRDDTPALVGRATPNETVTITIDAGTANETTFTTVANAVGDWFVFSPALTDGPHTIDASVDDGMGQTDTDSVTITVDTTPPSLSLDTPADGDQTNDTTPTISGTSDPGQVVTISVDGVDVGTATADSNGDWSFTPTTALADGSHLIEATTSDDVGNQISQSATITVDTVAPTVAVTSPADGARVGSSQPTIAGRTEPGATVDVSIDGTFAGTTTADSNGDWSFVPATPLADGAHTASATATDEAGNVSPPSSVGFTVDTDLPYVVILTPGDQTSTDQSQPEIAGQAEPNVDVEVSIDGTVVATVMADSMGNWSYTPATPLSEGAHVVVATADDGANTSSDTVTFEVDLTPPSLVVTSPTSGDSVPANPTVVGTAEPGATVVVTLPDGSTFSTTADSNGDWSVIVGPLAEGMATIGVAASDSAGNSTSTTVDVVVDDTAPFVKIDNPDDNSTKNDPVEPFEGTTDEPGAEVVLILDGVEIARVTADSAGNWIHTPAQPLTEGLHTLDAQVTDGAGNTGNDVVDFIVDTRAPDVEIDSPAENEVSTVARPPISGTAPPNSSVEIFIDGVKVGDTTADANGDWTFTLSSDLADGEHRVLARTTDSAGNVGDDEVVFVVDTVLPFVTITAPADGSTTSMVDVTVIGEAKPGELVEVFVDGTKVGEATADANGAWSLVVTGLAEGMHTVQADAGGATDTTTFEVDRSAPDVQITDPADGSLTNDDQPTVSGTAEPGVVVEIFVDGTKVGETTADANGDWSFEIGPVADGNHEIEAIATDEAGNQGSSGVVVITVDTTPPDLVVDNPVDGDSVEGGSTIRGTAEPGATIEIFVDGMKVGETTAGADGSWEYELDDPGAGEHDIVVVATDPAGNMAEVGPIVVDGGAVTGNNGNNGNGNNGNNGNGGTTPDDDPFSDSYLQGGCSQSRGGLPGAWLLLLAGLFISRRRRRK